MIRRFICEVDGYQTTDADAAMIHSETYGHKLFEIESDPSRPQVREITSEKK